MRYITDIIGDDYLNWDSGESILISTPTGSGKSAFVLKKLLPHAISKGKHILYLCNRKILESQFTTDSEKELKLLFADAGGIPDDMRHAIHITTYQRCETSKRFPDFDIPPNLSKYSREDIVRMERKHCLPETKVIRAEDILYCVFDEAHYMISDSQFNAKINFWSCANFQRGFINIFLTATPEPFTAFMVSRDPKFKLQEHIRKIQSTYDEKAQTRKKLSKPRVIIKVGRISGTAYDDISFEKQRVIDAKCREIEPYAEAICDLKLHQKNLNFRTYTAQLLENPYSGISSFYFRELDDLLPQLLMSTSENKWLIFVDREQDGMRLLGRLEQAGIPAAFLSAESIKHPGKARDEFCNITKKGYFVSSVLLATSVMDCGVSIVDSSVKNVAIAHHNKTTFLQMLGRVRLSDNRHIRIFIKMYNVQVINGVRNEYDKRLRFLTKFALRNSYDWEQAYLPTDRSDGMVRKPVLSKINKKDIAQEIQTPANISLLYNRCSTQGTNQEILREFEISKSAYVALLNEIAEYLDALNVYRNSGDVVFYLKRQLSWIGKEYKEENWLGYDEAKAKIADYLSKLEGKVLITDADKDAFCAECMNLLEAFPLPPVVWKNDRCRYRRGVRLPKIHQLNAALVEKKVPYEICSNRKSQKGVRNTSWLIKRK